MYLGTRMMVEMLSALKGDLCLVWTINAIAAIDASRLGPVFGWKWLIAIHIYIYIYVVMGLF